MALSLRVAEDRVRRGDERLGGRAVLRKARHARADREAGPFPHRVARASGELPRLGQIAVRYEKELVSPVATEHIALTDDARERARGVPEDEISCAVSPLVVHLLKLVEIEEDHRERLLRPFRTMDR